MTEYDTFADGIGITTLASVAPDTLADTDPVPINGVVIPERTVLQGGQGVRHHYPPEMARRAAEVLQQQIDADDQTVHIVKNFHDLEGQAPADDIIGEVTGAGYNPGVGTVFEGEVTDHEIAGKIQHGYLDVSPSVARALGDQRDDQLDSRPVTDVAGFRDIATVGQGQPGADVDVGPNPAIEALSRDVLTDGGAEGDGNTDGTDDTDDSMTLDDAKATVAEEFDIDVDDLEAAINDYGEAMADVDDDVVILVESDD